MSGYDAVRAEVPYGASSRIDLLLESDDRPPAYVEVKNVHLRRTGALAEFPDCVTTRGAKHLRELQDVVASGARAAMLFIVQRSDCDRFAPAVDLDPAYAEGLAEAARAGVDVLCYDCQISTEEVVLRRSLPVRIDDARPGGGNPKRPAKPRRRGRPES